MDEERRLPAMDAVIMQVAAEVVLATKEPGDFIIPLKLRNRKTLRGRMKLLSHGSEGPNL